jgi:nitrate reductase NapAB chaperone NapD
MPVMSFIALPVSGAKDELLKVLNAMQYCEAFPADNKDVLVLVTDTPDKDTDKDLHTRLKDLETLESLSMTFGYSDEQHMRKGDNYEGQ